VLAPVRVFPPAANAAPLPLPRWERPARSGRAQSASLLSHAAVLAALVLLVFPAHNPDSGGPTSVRIPPIFSPSAHFLSSLMGSRPSTGRGSGGGQIPIPTTAGDFVPVSCLQIVRPSLPPKRESILPVAPTIL